MKYFIANWKANKNFDEVKSWLDGFFKLYKDNKDTIVIICPPFPFITLIKDKISNFENLKLGSQDLSLFEQGAYTGEVSAKTLQGLIEYVIIGHSERRKNFGESNEAIHQKITLAKKYKIEPIFCIRDQNDLQDKEMIKIVAYEPVYAIGTGNNEPLDKVIQSKEKLNLPSNTVFLYGGSVNENNAKDYLQSDEIDGFLVGGASLNPERFYKIISQV